MKKSSKISGKSSVRNTTLRKTADKTTLLTTWKGIAKSPLKPKGLLESCLKTNEIVDLYTSEWLRKNYKKIFAGKSSTSYKEFMLKNENVVSGSYLILALDDYRPEIKAALLRGYPKLKTGGVVDGFSKELGMAMYNPDFLIFNTITGQTIAFGLGRKNIDFFFAIDRQGKIEKKYKYVPDFLISPSKFKKDFLKNDISGVIPTLLTAFHQISEGWSRVGDLPINPETAGELLKKKTHDGIYRTEFDEQFSKQDLLLIIKKYKESDKLIANGEMPFRQIFSRCNLLKWELNTGDF